MADEVRGEKKEGKVVPVALGREPEETQVVSENEYEECPLCQNSDETPLLDPAATLKRCHSHVHKLVKKMRTAVEVLSKDTDAPKFEEEGGSDDDDDDRCPDDGPNDNNANDSDGGGNAEDEDQPPGNNSGDANGPNDDNANDNDNDSNGGTAEDEDPPPDNIGDADPKAPPEQGPAGLPSQGMSPQAAAVVRPRVGGGKPATAFDLQVRMFGRKRLQTALQPHFMSYDEGGREKKKKKNKTKEPSPTKRQRPKHECSICGKVVTQIKNHMLIHLGPSRPMFPCPNCHKEFTAPKNVRRHLLKEVCGRQT